MSRAASGSGKAWENGSPLIRLRMARAVRHAAEPAPARRMIDRSFASSDVRSRESGSRDYAPGRWEDSIRPMDMPVHLHAPRVRLWPRWPRLASILPGTRRPFGSNLACNRQPDQKMCWRRFLPASACAWAGRPAQPHVGARALVSDRPVGGPPVRSPAQGVRLGRRGNLSRRSPSIPLFRARRGAGQSGSGVHGSRGFLVRCRPSVEV